MEKGEKQMNEQEQQSKTTRKAAKRFRRFVERHYDAYIFAGVNLKTDIAYVAGKGDASDLDTLSILLHRSVLRQTQPEALKEAEDKLPEHIKERLRALFGEEEGNGTDIPSPSL